MPIVKKPGPLPSPLDYVPAGSQPYKVSEGETWWTLSEHPDVIASGMSASDLCYYNFKTRRASEINWYLYHKVGCRRTTRSGKNYVFSRMDSPGIVYLPKLGVRPPVNEIEPKPKLDTKLWVGIGLKTGTQNMTVGQDQLSGFAVSIDNPERWMALSAYMTRQGLGMGTTGGLSVILVGGVTQPHQLNGHQQGEFDFNVAIGGNVGRAAKAGVAAKKFGPLLNSIRKIGAKTPSSFRKALLDDPDKVADLVKLMKANKEAWGLGANKPNVLVIDTPAGAGGELSLFYSTATFTAVGFGDDD